MSQILGLTAGTRVYIAGPMTGRPDNNVPAFDEAARDLRSIDLQPVSPADIARRMGIDPIARATPQQYASFMRADLAELVTCQAIAMLPGWQHSRGASFERQAALICGLEVIYMHEEDDRGQVSGRTNAV